MARQTGEAKVSAESRAHVSHAHRRSRGSGGGVPGPERAHVLRPVLRAAGGDVRLPAAARQARPDLPAVSGAGRALRGRPVLGQEPVRQTPSRLRDADPAAEAPGGERAGRTAAPRRRRAAGRVSLTEEGLALRRQADDIVPRLEAAMGLTEEELAQTRTLLRRLTGNLIARADESG